MSDDFFGSDGVALCESGEFEVFLFAVDFKKAVKDNDFASGFECFVGGGAGF